MSCPRCPVPDPYRHHRLRDSLRRAKAVPGKYRGCYRIPCGPPFGNQSLPGCPAVCSLRVNFSFGTGLYMAPSNMLLRVGNVAGYNNLIIIATDSQSLGLNSDLNTVDAPPDAATHTGEMGLVQPDVSVTTPPASTTPVYTSVHRPGE